MDSPAHPDYVESPDDGIGQGRIGINNMGRRVGYGALAIAAVLVIFTSDAILARTARDIEGPLGDLLRCGSVVPLVMVVLFVIGAVELVQMQRLNGARPHAAFAYLMTAILILGPWLSAAGWLGRGAAQVEGLYWQVVWVIVAVIGTGVLTVKRRNPSGAIRDMNATLMSVLCLGFVGSFGVQLRCSRDVPDDNGVWLLLIVVLVTKASDIGAYLVGSALGRHKLIPSISPGKSVEGAIGGLMCSVLAATAFSMAGGWTAPMGSVNYAAGEEIAGLAGSSLLAEISTAFNLIHPDGGQQSVIRALILGLAMSISGQIGDLIESCFKRDAGVKDSGDIIPRYGGILDLIDSLIPAMAVAWLLFTAVWNVV